MIKKWILIFEPMKSIRIMIWQSFDSFCNSLILNSLLLNKKMNKWINKINNSRISIPFIKKNNKTHNSMRDLILLTEIIKHIQQFHLSKSFIPKNNKAMTILYKITHHLTHLLIKINKVPGCYSLNYKLAPHVIALRMSKLEIYLFEIDGQLTPFVVAIIVYTVKGILSRCLYCCNAL